MNVKIQFKHNLKIKIHRYQSDVYEENGFLYLVRCLPMREIEHKYESKDIFRVIIYNPKDKI